MDNSGSREAQVASMDTTAALASQNTNMVTTPEKNSKAQKKNDRKRKARVNDSIK